MASGRRLALAVVGLVLLGACKVELAVVTEVRDDGSGEVVITVLLGETARQTLRAKELKSDDPLELAELRRRGEDVFARGPEPVDLLEEGVPAGWEVERVVDGASEGLRLTAEFAALDEIPNLLDSLAGFGEALLAQYGRDPADLLIPAMTRGFSLNREGPVFRFRAQPNAEAYEGATGGANNPLAELRLTATLPGGIVEHDADEVDGRTLTWHIAPGESRTISATSDLTDNRSGVPVIGIGAGAVAIALLGSVFLWRRDWRRSGGGEEPPPAGDREEAPLPV